MEITGKEYGRLVEADVFRDYHVKGHLIPNLERILALMEEDPEMAKGLLRIALRALKVAANGYREE